MRRRRRHATAASLDALLDGARDDGTALARVLAAARAPANPRETTGLDAARTAFIGAANAPRPARPKRHGGTRSVAGRLVALKAIAAVSGASLIGGVAYAASSTNLLNHPSGHHPGHHRSAASSESAPAPSASVRHHRQQPIDEPKPTTANHPANHRQHSASARPTRRGSVAVTPSGPASHNPPVAPTHKPTPTPLRHAKTTPPQKPTRPPGKPSVHPSAANTHRP